MEQVIIGVDPHKLSATIEVVDSHENLLSAGRFTTDKPGYAAMRTYVNTWPDRVWAVEGAKGAGRPLAQRLVEAGERVIDVPASSRPGSGSSAQGTTARPTDALDAHSIAVRTTTLRVVAPDRSSRHCGCSPTAATSWHIYGCRP